MNGEEIKETNIGRIYIDIPKSRYIFEEDFQKYVSGEELKTYELKQDILERLEILNLKNKEDREEALGVINSIIDDRLSEFRDVIEKRISEEIGKTKKVPKQEERIKMPFKW